MPQQNRSNNKMCKKSTKSRKAYPKRSYNDNETDDLPDNSIKKIINFSESLKSNSKSVTPTKVKSGSWKRSEKSIIPFNALANKKPKTLRKKSPNWLKFSNSKISPNQLANGSELTSACRPGTLYSDVLFSAGCSNLVKIKNCTTPRFYNLSPNAAQEKLTEALFKFNGNQGNETSDESEVEEKKNLFPALQKVDNKIHSVTRKSDNNNFQKSTTTFKQSISNNNLTNTSIPPTKDNGYEEADVVILSNMKGSSLVENDVSYGNYLEQHFQDFSGILDTKPTYSTKDSKFLISSISNIPKWNFISVETSSFSEFPKFLNQFDDENYLKTEKIALLALKLALGNYSTPNK